MIYRTVLLSIFVVIGISTIETNGQRFSLRGQSYPNHGLVLREDIGETDNGDLDPNDGLHCIGFDGCCSSGDLRGEYVIPGTTTTVPTLDNIGASGYYRNRRSDRIFLNRRGGTTQGIFQCQIRTESNQTTYETFYIGVYGADSGTPSITSITFDNADTLTCTSSGGPATSVKWRRNCLLLQSSDTNFIPSQTVTTTGSATYDNSLKLPSTDNDGVYTCSVSNIRGYSIDLIGVGAAYTPLPVDVTISAGSTPVAGQSFTLTCGTTTSLSSPTYQWFSDSGAMIGNSSTLTIDPLLESGTGEYSCQVSAGSGANQRYGCGVERVVVQAPALTVTVNNVGNAVAGTSHTLSCSVSGANLEGATMTYVWQLNDVDIAGATSSTYDITSVRVSDAGGVYTCHVTVMASYWDVSGSFRGSGSGSLMVSTTRLPICPRRWSSTSLSSLTIDWQPPVQHNGDITGYFLELVTYDNQTVLQSDNVASNTFTYTFNGLNIAAGVPYHVRVYTEDINGRGRHCVTTDFGDQLSPPSTILSDSIISPSYNMSSGSSETAAVLTWTVLPLDQAKGYISLSITFGPLTNTAARQKRQTSGETVECAQSPCQVPYEQGRVRILGLDSERDNFIIVIPENEEGEIGTPVATGIAAETTCAPCTCPSCTCPSFTYPPPKSGNSTTLYGMAAVLVLLLLLLFMAVLVIVVMFVKLSRSKQAYDLSAINVGPDKTDIPTNQCEAYEVMKLQDKPKGQSQMYEEVEEGLATGSGRGRHTTTSTTQVEESESTAHQTYEEVGVGEGLTSKATPSQKKEKPGSSNQEEEASHYD